MRPEEDEERQGPRAVNRSRGKATVRERRLLSEEQECRVGQRVRMNQRSWWLCGNFARIHKPQKSIKNFSLIALGANPSPCLFILSVIYVVSVVCL